jgi:hypothetical protein
MKPKATPPCRLQVVLARRAPMGVIFRRGPSKWVQIIKWDTRQDTFEAGQWFHGHIYVERCDLSPNGSFLIYFASKFNRKTISDKEYTYAWTAISRPPLLTALALWPKGDCWHGGGLFTGPREVWLNHRSEAAVPHPKHLPKGFRVTPNPNAMGEDDPVFISRMTRDGWRFMRGLEYDYRARRTVQPALMEKTNKKGDLTLRVEHYPDDGTEEPCVISIVKKDGSELSVGIGTWADFDQQGRLVLASEGKLLAGAVTNGKVVLTPLANFSNSTPNWERRNSLNRRAQRTQRKAKALLPQIGNQMHTDITK